MGDGFLINKRLNDIEKLFFSKEYPKKNSARTAGEGFWSCLYRTEQARNVTFRTELNYGEDSLFLIHYLTQAKRITWSNRVLYRHYQLTSSVMNAVSRKRILDSFFWRLWASIILRNNGTNELARFIGVDYWPPNIFEMAKDAGINSQDYRLIRDNISQLEAVHGAPPKVHWVDDLMEKGAVVEGTATEDGLAARQGLSMPLSVNIFVSTDRGGAAIGSVRRKDALRQAGVEAKLVTGLKAENGSETVEMSGPSNKRQVFVDKIVNGIWGAEFCVASELFSRLGTIISYQENKEYFEDTDVIHFHWVTGIIDEKNWDILRGRPFCWTMADMNPFTGGCHYSEGCEEFRRSCQDCPLLTGQKEIAAEQWARKKRLYDMLGRFTVICPSQWIADRARESSLFGDKDIVVIPNAFPTDRFVPSNKTVARLRLGLPIDKTLLLFGADSLTNRRKGGDLLQEALDILANGDQLYDTQLIVFGANSINLPAKVHPMGRVTDESKLAMIYSAADAFLFPSREDNAPLTVGESLLCGTPVVAFPVGNVPDILTHNKTGYIAAYGDTKDFANGIKWAIDMDREARTRMSVQCRLVSTRYHDPRVAAARHVALYKRMICDAYADQG